MRQDWAMHNVDLVPSRERTQPKRYSKRAVDYVGALAALAKFRLPALIIISAKESRGAPCMGRILRISYIQAASSMGGITKRRTIQSAK